MTAVRQKAEPAGYRKGMGKIMRKRLQHTKKLAGICCMGALILGMVLTGCGDKKQDDTSSATESTTSSEVTSAPTEHPTPTPEAESTTAETTAEPVTKKQLSEDEAFVKLIEKIDPNDYTVASAGEYFYEDRSYFRYTISKDGEMISDVLVDRESGELFYLNSDNVIAEFDKFPPDQAQPVTQPSDGTITQDEALALLKKINKETLKLPADLTEYTIQFDDWTTMVNGKECYGVNAFADLGSRKQLMGVYYVAVDGRAMYTLDEETGEFLLMEE